jgi:hypothetical protein
MGRLNLTSRPIRRLEQLRQFGDGGRDPTRLVLGEPFHGTARFGPPASRDFRTSPR